MKRMYPDRALEELPMGHPLYKMGEALGEVRYAPGAARDGATPRRPVLEFIEVDGRTVIVYSKYDISSAIEGHPCYTCPAVLEPSAGRLAMKIVLFGLSS
jgi:hypothetical protein